jgi:hypothetical protein
MVHMLEGLTEKIVSNPKLRDAMQLWAVEACEFIKAKAAVEIEPLITSRKGIRFKANSIEHLEIPTPVSPWSLLQNNLEELTNFESYKQVLEEFSNTAEIVSLIGHFVGTDSHSTLLQSHWLLLEFIHELWKVDKKLDFNIDKFSSVYVSFEDFIYNPLITRRLIAPLEYFDSEVLEIDLGKGLRIKALTDEEFEDLYIEGGTFRDTYKTQNVSRKYFVIISESQQPKLVIREDEERGIYEPRLLAPRERMEALCRVLRVLKKGTVGFRIVHERHPWVGSTGAVFQRIYWQGSILALTADDVERLKELWQSYKCVDFKVDKFLRVATERFSNGLDRLNSEDRIIDFVICLEALFLSGIGNAGDWGEISYRFALHGARFLEKDIPERKRVFHDLRAAYRVRNPIIHGGSYKLPKAETGKTMSLAEFCELLENYSRNSLRQFLSGVRKPVESASVDWQDVVLS